MLTSLIDIITFCQFIIFNIDTFLQNENNKKAIVLK